MDFSSMGVGGVAVITVLCYMVGQVVKITPASNKVIPVAVGIAGGVLGVVGMHIMPDFPAHDVMTAAAVGIVSGLAATGFNQIGKQLGGGSK